MRRNSMPGCCEGGNGKDPAFVPNFWDICEPTGLKTLQAFKVNYQLRTVFAKNDLPSFLGGLEH